MSRAERLLDLLQLLRRHRYPVSGAALAAELGVSLRTVYRDISSLQAQGASIEGEAGIGYRLGPGFMLPPLMFSEDEMEAITLGASLVAQRTDSRLGAAAHNALAKIAAVLPATRRDDLDASALVVAPKASVDRDLRQLREAIRAEHKLLIRYVDFKAVESQRTIWPFALVFFEQQCLLVGWCESRQAFRHFRVDRIAEMALSEARYPARRRELLKQWKAVEGIPAH